MISKLNLIAAATLLLVACSSKQQSEEKTTAEPPKPVVQNDLPFMMVQRQDGVKINLRDVKGETVIVLFQPDCDHCEREAAAIKEHLTEFKAYSLYFVTSAPWPRIERFAREYKLLEEPNVAFVMTDVESIVNNFGSVPTPSVYIFGNGGHQKAKLNGETDIMQIISSL